MLWEMLSWEGLKWPSLSGRTVPKCHTSARAAFPAALAGKEACPYFPAGNLCSVKYSHSQPTLTLTSCTQGGFVALIHIFGGLPSRNHPAPSFSHPCSPCRALSRSFHTLPWSRTSSSCSLSSLVNPARWAAPERTAVVFSLCCLHTALIRRLPLIS